MRVAREKPRLVASGRYLYAIGGADPTGLSLASMERYDPRSNSWRMMNPMHESRWVSCAVETTVGKQRVLVAIGGVQAVGFNIVGGGLTTEVFNIDTGRWTLLRAKLPQFRGGHACATEADGTVLAIGGAIRVGTNIILVSNVDALSIKPHDLRH